MTGVLFPRGKLGIKLQGMKDIEQSVTDIVSLFFHFSFEENKSPNPAVEDSLYNLLHLPL